MESGDASGGNKNKRKRAFATTRAKEELPPETLLKEYAYDTKRIKATYSDHGVANFDIARIEGQRRCWRCASIIPYPIWNHGNVTRYGRRATKQVGVYVSPYHRGKAAPVCMKCYGELKGRKKEIRRFKNEHEPATQA